MSQETPKPQIITPMELSFVPNSDGDEWATAYVVDSNGRCIDCLYFSAKCVKALGKDFIRKMVDPFMDAEMSRKVNAQWDSDSD